MVNCDAYKVETWYHVYHNQPFAAYSFFFPIFKIKISSQFSQEL